MYAVVTTGGKQYRVEPGNELEVERLSGDAGSSVTFDRVLLVGDGEAVTIGTPTVEGATVSGTVLGEALGPKLIIFKFKQKATYRRKNGHRQHLTRIRIDEINASGKTSNAKAEKAEKAEARAEKAEKPAKADTAKATAETEKPKRTRKPAAARETKAEATSTADAGTATEKPKRTRKPATKKSAEE
jgi:large subunit ribosomal protein L21